MYPFHLADIETALEQAEEKLAALTPKYIRARCAVNDLKIERSVTILLEERIYSGDRVIVDFSDGPCKGIYERVRDGGQVVVQLLNSKGKPYKRKHHVSVESIKRAEGAV